MYINYCLPPALIFRPLSSSFACLLSGRPHVSSSRVGFHVCLIISVFPSNHPSEGTAIALPSPFSPPLSLRSNPPSDASAAYLHSNGATCSFFFPGRCERRTTPPQPPRGEIKNKTPINKTKLRSFGVSH